MEFSRAAEELQHFIESMQEDAKSDATLNKLGQKHGSEEPCDDLCKERKKTLMKLSIKHGRVQGEEAPLAEEPVKVTDSGDEEHRKMMAHAIKAIKQVPGQSSELVNRLRKKDQIRHGGESGTQPLTMSANPLGWDTEDPELIEAANEAYHEGTESARMKLRQRIARK